jgi:hypothetical protein
MKDEYASVFLPIKREVETKFNRIEAALDAECNPQCDFFTNFIITNFILSEGDKEGVFLLSTVICYQP